MSTGIIREIYCDNFLSGNNLISICQCISICWVFQDLFKLFDGEMLLIMLKIKNHIQF